MKEGKNGVTSDTPKKVLFGAGTIHKNLTYTAVTYELTSDTSIVAGKTYYTRSGSSPNYVYTVVASPVIGDIGNYYEKSGGWNFSSSIVGATSGGSKLEIIPTITEIEVDGALVAVKGITHQKTGETASMEVNFIEVSDDVLKAALIAQAGTSEDADYSVLVSKANIVAGDYWDNIAFVGEDLNGGNIIAILPNALCTSGLSLEGKSKEASKPAVTFICTADASGDLDKLPWKIYRPTA